MKYIKDTTTEYVGENCMVDFVHLKSGLLIAVNDAYICVYKNVSEFYNGESIAMIDNTPPDDPRVFALFYRDNFELTEDSKMVKFDFFGTDNGYDFDAVHIIDNLELNETANLSECHNAHYIKRII